MLSCHWLPQAGETASLSLSWSWASLGVPRERISNGSERASNAMPLPCHGRRDCSISNTFFYVRCKKKKKIIWKKNQDCYVYLEKLICIAGMLPDPDTQRSGAGLCSSHFRVRWAQGLLFPQQLRLPHHILFARLPDGASLIQKDKILKEVLKTQSEKQALRNT